MKRNYNNYASLNSSILQEVKLKVITSMCVLITSAAFGGTYPQVGDRVYSLPKDTNESSELSEPSIIVGLGEMASGIKDPIKDRDLPQKSIVSGDLSGKLPMAEGKRLPKVNRVKKEKVSNKQQATAKQRDRRPKKSSFVDLKSMAITGRTTNPSLKFTVGDRPLEPSDSVRTPKLIDNVYEDAKKIR